jgi:hydroxypyruvate isomerase
MIPLTDPARHEEFLEGLRRGVDVARRLGTGTMIAQAGDDLPGRTRAEQRAALTACLARAADILKGSGVVLAVEPLNTLVDHLGYFLSSTAEGLDIIDDVARPEIRLLYDLYHSMVMEEVPEDVLAGRVDRIAHIHVADHPGRNQPGTGHLPLRRVLDWLQGQGYAGMAGLEFRPTADTETALAETFTALGVPGR